ncbi:MAG: hypothetical protein LLG00_14535 [Planctomycetaceae bacterium]|nr:hypothetical protein [Planctomycetaceae bacterium]
MMQAIEAVPSLNRILGLLCHSLPAYLSEAKPWRGFSYGEVDAVIERLAADQHRYARRVAEAITRLGGQPNPGHFRAAFAAKNDLSMDYLLHDVLECQEQDIASITRYAAEVDGVPALHALIEEILGNAKGYRDVLKGMAK